MGAIRAFICLMRTQWGCKVAIFKLDGERALGTAFTRFCDDEGIEIIESLPYMPEQNGPIERAGRAIAERSQSLIIDAQLPKSLWSEAFKTATYMLNRTPTRVPKLDDSGEYEWIIPIQQLHALTTGYNVRPNLANLRIYGCRAYVKQTAQDIGSQHDKMEPRALIGYLVSFVASNIWHVWIPERKHVVSARDVVFDESKQYNLDDPFPIIKIEDVEPDIPVEPLLSPFSTPQLGGPPTPLPPLGGPAREQAAAQQQYHAPAAQIEDINRIQELPELPQQAGSNSRHISLPCTQMEQPPARTEQQPAEELAQQPAIIPYGQHSSSVQPAASKLCFALVVVPEQRAQQWPPPILSPIDEEMAEELGGDEDNRREMGPVWPGRQQMPQGQIVGEGMATAGLSTPYTPGLPNTQAALEPHLPTTPPQQTTMPMATPATLGFNQMANPEPMDTAPSPIQQPVIPQAAGQPTTPQPETAAAEPREPPAAPNIQRYSWNEPMPPPPPVDNTWVSPVAPSDEIFGDPQDPRNIRTGPHPRRPRQDPDFHTYTTFQPEGVEHDMATGLQQAYSIGLADANQKPGPKRLHQSQLPPEPKHWRDLRKHQFQDEFIQAAHVEQQGLAKRGTYTVEDTPKISWLSQRGKRIVPLKWVFTYKFDEDGYLAKFKVCICARGDLQAVTNDETWAATLATRIFCMIVAMVAAFDLETDQLDAVNTFLNSLLDEEEYVSMPPGMSSPGKVWRLLKVLYRF